MKPTPLVSLLRILDTPTRSMSLPYHAELLARHYVDKPDILAEVVSLCDYLSRDVGTDEQSRQILEWAALRLPVGGAMAQQRDSSDVSVECGRKIDCFIRQLCSRVDLSSPILDEDVREGLDGTLKDLGYVLLALGHDVPLDVYTPQDIDLPSLVRTATSHGQYKRVAGLLGIAQPLTREESLRDAWEAIARARPEAGLDGLDLLPDPSSEWWARVQRNDITLSGDRIAQRILLDRPHLLVDYVGGVILQGEPRKVHPQILEKAMQRQASWESEEGWRGDALAVLVSRAGDEEQPFSARIRQITQDAACLARAPNAGPVPTRHLVQIIAAASETEKDLICDPEFKALCKEHGAGKSGVAAKISSLHEHWGQYPRGKLGAISGGMCEVSGRAMARWSDSDHMVSNFLPLVRQAYTHEIFAEALGNEDHDAVHAQARSVRLLLGKAMAGERADLDSFGQQEKNEYLELMLWHFASERLGRLSKDHKKKGDLVNLSPRQVSMARKIDSMIDGGAVPAWTGAARQIGQELMTFPMVNLPPPTLANLERSMLDATPQPQGCRRGARL